MAAYPRAWPPTPAAADAGAAASLSPAVFSRMAAYPDSKGSTPTAADAGASVSAAPCSRRPHGRVPPRMAAYPRGG